MSEPWNGGPVYKTGMTLVESLQHHLQSATTRIKVLEEEVERLESKAQCCPRCSYAWYPEEDKIDE